MIMDNICYDTTGEIDNKNIPDEFIEITSLMRLRKKKMKGNLAKIVHSEFDDFNELSEIIEYALMSGRSYYHSFFTEIIGETCGVSEGKRRFLGSMFEMMYNYFEMQNNVSELDNIEYRNSKPTCQKKYGVGKTIVASNAILSLIYKLITDSDVIKLSSKDRCKIISILTKYSGKNGLAGGQILNIISKNKKLYDDELTRMQRLKISSLFFAIFECIEVLSEMNDKQKKGLKTYVENFCHLLEIYEKIKQNDKSTIDGLIKRAEIIKNQSIKAIKNIGIDNKKLNDFINYNHYILNKVAKDLNKTDTITSNIENNHVEVK